MNTLLDFLNLILPNEGWFCACVLKEGKLYHKFVRTHEELAQILLEEDAKGHTVYHACASFKEPTRRKKTNVHLVKSLWFDLDAGEGKQYETPKEAYAATEEFRNNLNVGRPLYVGSGSGLHVYWPLATAIDPVEWQHYAQGLREAARRGRLGFDPPRTCDEASILRPPGSHNYKSGTPIEVRCALQGVYPNELSLLSSIRAERIDRFDSGNAGFNGLGPVPQYLRSLKRIEGIQIHGEPSLLPEVANRCRQLGNFRDKLGVLPEPLWFACLSIAAHCEGGDELGHEWSKGDDRYTYQDTQSRLDRCREDAGPGTCERFEDLNSKDCEGCPFRGKIKSPIQLGRKARVEATQERLGQNPDGGLNGHHSPVSPPFEASSILLPEGFKWGSKGSLCGVGEQSWTGGQTVTGPDKLIIGHPFYLKDIQKGQAYNYVFACKKPLTDWEDILVPAEATAGMNVSAQIRKRGVAIHDVPLFNKYVIGHHTMLEEEKKSDIRYEQNGWQKTGCFICGDRKYVDGQCSQAALSAAMLDGSDLFTPIGSFDAWHAAASLMLEKGIKAQAFALIASLGAVFMRYESPNEGGGIISFVSQASSRGKSTALQAAISVWGGWRALTINNTDSDNYKMIKIGTANNLPVAYDEIVAQDPQKLKNFVATYSEGKDRGRATVDGRAQKEPYTWSNIMITSSNTSLVDTLNSASASNAPSFRILEFTLNDRLTAPPAGADYFPKAFSANYGWLGHVFLRYVTSPVAFKATLSQLDYSRTLLVERFKLKNVHRFWTRTLTCAHTAAVILERLKLFPGYDFKEVVFWAASELMESDRGDGIIEETRESLNASDALARYISENFKDFLIVDRAGDRCMVLQGGPRQKIVARSERIDQRLFISESHLKRWCVEAGINIREMMGQLKKMGVMKGKERINLAQGTDYPPATMPAYCFDQAQVGLPDLQSGDDTPPAPRQE